MALNKVPSSMLADPNTGGGGIQGLIFGNDPTSPNTHFVMSSGSIPTADRDYVLEFPLGLRKNLTAAFSAGNNGGALDTGAIAASTWYHVFAIGNTTTEATDLLASVSFSNPVLPAGFTKFERVFSLFSDGSSNIKQFNHKMTDKEDFVRWKQPVVSLSSGNDGQQIGRNRSVLVPPGAKFKAILLHIVADAATSSFAAGLMDPDLGTAALYNAVTTYHNANLPNWYEVEANSNVNSQVVSFSNVATLENSVISIVSKGYHEVRGS
ncbi:MULTISPECIES: hypothetical protein [unclassified Sinorhizobium]|uniref:hypothetical protein n=1 Tax=unclassified Sinorhizobium TaxID=2613772 RepID=UPI003524B97C